MINAPVLITSFTRYETLEKVFEQIRIAKPKVLYVAIDGPRNEADILNNNKCREIANSVDWDCEYHPLFSDTNNGILKNTMNAYEEVFKKYDRLIFLEDDMFPSQSFFAFCDSMLEHYKDDRRVQVVSGMNFQEKTDYCKGDYFFSKQFCVGAMGIWKRTYDSWDKEFAFCTDECLCEEVGISKSRVKRAVSERLRVIKGGEVGSIEFMMDNSFYLNSCLGIVPRVNLAKSIGISAKSAHTSDSLKKIPHKIRRLFLFSLYEMEEPYRQPTYVVNNEAYNQYCKKLFCIEHPVLLLFMRIEKVFLYIINGDICNLFREFKDKIIRRDRKNG